MNKTASISLAQQRAIAANKRKAELFKHDQNKADEIYFKKWVNAWLLTEPARRPMWPQLLDSMVLKRNKPGQPLKYCYYNAGHQKSLPTPAFINWCVFIREEIKKKLTRYYG